jgi:DNA invertase Pin-like site-specific DNA recombinase
VIFAYTYSDPLLDEPMAVEVWGVEVDRVYTDIGQRHQLRALMAEVAQTPPAYLLLRKLDELGDTLKTIGDRLQTLENAGVKIITIEQDYQSGTAEGTPPLSDIFQEISDRQVSRKIQQGHAKNRQRGLPPPGRTPYGYKRGQDRYLLDRSTAPIVQDFCEYFLLYGSLRGAVRYLERRFGKKIAVSTGRNWLTNPVYRGNLSYKDGTMIANTHAAILTDSEAAQIDRLLRRNRHLAPRSASAPRCLAGLVQCHHCQQPLTVAKVTRRRSTQEYLYLRSPHCPEQPKCPAIAYDAVFKQTIQTICQTFPKIVQSQQAPPLEQIQTRLQQQLQTKQSLIDQLPQLIQQGIFDQASANLRQYHLQNEIAQLQQQQSQLPPSNLQAIAQTITHEQFWFDLSEAERRFYLREFLAQIFIQPSPQENWQIQLKFIF